MEYLSGSNFPGEFRTLELKDNGRWKLPRGARFSRPGTLPVNLKHYISSLQAIGINFLISTENVWKSFGENI